MNRLFVLALWAGVALPLKSDFDAERLSANTTPGMELWHVPGMSVTVVSAQEILFQQGLIFEPLQLASPADFYPTTRLTNPNWRRYG